MLPGVDDFESLDCAGKLFGSAWFLTESARELETMFEAAWTGRNRTRKVAHGVHVKLCCRQISLNRAVHSRDGEAKLDGWRTRMFFGEGQLKKPARPIFIAQPRTV